MIKYIVNKNVNKTDYIKKFENIEAKYNCIDLINKRNNNVKNEYVSLFGL